MIVPCDHSFGWEAPVIHLGRGFFLSHDKMFMIEGVVLTSPSAMQEPVTASLPSHCSPRGTEEAPSGLLLFLLNGHLKSVWVFSVSMMSARARLTDC